MRKWIVIVLVWIYLSRLGAGWAHAAPEPLPFPSLDRTAPSVLDLTVQPLDRLPAGDGDGDDDGGDDGGRGGGDDDGGDDGSDDGDGDDGDGVDGGEDDGMDDGDHDNDHDRDDGDYEDGGRAYAAAYSFYGQVRWSGERTIVGNRELVGDDPWIAYLAPGMRLEVKGKAQGSRILVTEIEIKYPTAWAYYLGPAQVIGLEGGWVRAWLSGPVGRGLFKLLPAAGETTPVLVACFERGSWRSVPLGLRPDAPPPTDGWWRLSGRLSDSGVSWTPAGRLPGDCD